MQTKLTKTFQAQILPTNPETKLDPTERNIRLDIYTTHKITGRSTAEDLYFNLDEAEALIAALQAQVDMLK